VAPVPSTTARAGNVETDRAAAGVAGNARLTGSFGAVIFVLLAVEGITVVSVRSLLAMHVYVGMVLVPFALVKTATTTYRFARYYIGDRRYVEKGAPAFVLRVLGPFVVVTTLALLATGIGALWAGASARWVTRLHKATFIVWFGVMTIHVLGHVLETPALALADWRVSTRRESGGAAQRIALLFIATAAGIALAVWSRGWITSFHPLSDH
jgi:hypothetical protein